MCQSGGGVNHAVPRFYSDCLVNAPTLARQIEQEMADAPLTLTEGEHLVFMQCSDQLLTTPSEMRQYYTHAYAKMPGYALPPDFFEIPYWVPLIAGQLPTSAYRHSFHIVRDLDASARFMRAHPDATYLFSVLEANVNQIVALLTEVPVKAVLGGYVSKDRFAGLKNVRFLDGIHELSAIAAPCNPSALPDYRLFAGTDCIPRFSLSTGCAFRCAFCTVPTQLTLTPYEQIVPQAMTFRPLNFELIFLDDKSFGQASNWREIGPVRAAIQAYNPAFSGFIVQTPPSLAARPGFLEACAAMGVGYVELGVETTNDHILERLRKPFRMKHLETATTIARDLGLAVIPNLIIGIPGDNYRTTVEWVAANRDVIPVVNVNWLAIHYGNERGDLGLYDRTVADRDQNSDEKSWLSPSEVSAGWEAVHEIYDITSPGWTTERGREVSLRRHGETRRSLQPLLR